MYFLLLYAWWLMTAADGVGLLLAGMRLQAIAKSPNLSSTSRRFANVFCLLLFAFSFEAFLIVFADVFLSHGVMMSFIVTRLIGRTVKGAFAWYFVIYFLGIREGRESIHATSISDKSRG